MKDNWLFQILLKCFLIINSVYLAACVSHQPIVSPQDRTRLVIDLAKKAHWKKHSIQTSTFRLKAFGSPVKSQAKILTLYIEGDGLAWISEDRPSNNPTPLNPIALKMAIHDQNNHPVAYLARPCQFVFDKEWKGCQPAYWTNLRFSAEVLESMNQALDYLKTYYQVKQIRVIGYSGGGSIAALLSAQRTDVIQLITVAAILDLNQWVRQKSLTPLYGSLNPADFWKNLATIPQIHWVGGQDTVVPKEVAYAFAQRFPKGQKPRIILKPTFDHICCWADDKALGSATKVAARQ